MVVIYDGEVEPNLGETLLGIPAFISRCIRYIPKGSVFLGLYDQATKRTWWMPRRQEAMKDVVACDKLRGAGKQALIRRFPNGETWPFEVIAR